MRSGPIFLLLGLLAPRVCASNGKSATVKDGECPAAMEGPGRPPQNYCLSDESCAGSEKCCSDGNRRVCVLPDSVHPGYCPKPDPALVTTCLVSCLDDTRCSMDEKCCTIGCHRKCTKAVPASPGVCPKRKVLQTFAPCKNKCEDDRGCPRGQKCCFTGCGLDCVPPKGGANSTALPPAEPGKGWDWTRPAHEGSSAAATPEKPSDPGTCPPNLTRCLSTDPPLCANDADCQGQQRCCYVTCRFRCVDPQGDICQLPAKPGLCDAYSRRYFYNVSSQRCEEFLYRGCRGNANNFRTKAECVEACAAHEEAGTSPEGRGGQRCRTARDCPGAETCCSRRCRPECPAQSDGKPGFCPVHNGLYSSYECEARCRGDGGCPGAQKCCLRGCERECLPPSEEKPGICPLTNGLTSKSPSSCKSSCVADKECAAHQKCCDSGCGRTCQDPEREKPGTCPKQKPWQTLVPCNETDSCTHDRACARQEKCCFAGCAMRCVPHYKEHPGACPRAKACSDPQQRHYNQCLDDHVCERHEKCCDTGCRQECVAVRPEKQERPGDRTPGLCVDECRTDEECPRGQRCSSTGCGRVCQKAPRGAV